MRKNLLFYFFIAVLIMAAISLRYGAAEAPNKYKIVGKNYKGPFSAQIYFLNKKAKAVLERYIPKPEAYIIEAMVLGQRVRIPKRINDIFKKTGTSHILAISGLNVGLIASIVWIILRILFLPRSLSIVILALFLPFYCVFVGSMYPIVRATIMAEMVLLGKLINKKASMWNLLFLSALVIFLTDPYSIFDISFQLSFASVASMIYILPKFPATKSKLLSSIYVSVSAWVGIMPLVALYFELFTPVCLLANIVAVPLSFCATVASILSGFASIFSSHLAYVFGQSCWLVLRCMILSMELFSKIPFGCLNVAKPSPLEITAYYLAIITALRFIRH